MNSTESKPTQPEPMSQESVQSKAAYSGKEHSSRKAKSAFRTISEVADILDVQQHVLRFWETKFAQVKPLKRGGGRRYYRPEDVELLKTIRSLLYAEGYTIKGVQKLLREQGKNKIIQQQKTGPALAPTANDKPIASSFSNKQKEVLNTMLGELKEIRRMLDKG